MNQTDFFQECVGAYPEAMLSVAIFRNYVQSACTRVLSKRAPELEAALGLLRGELKLLPYASPDRLTAEEADAVCLGAKARTSEGAELLWAYLYWVLKEPPADGVVGTADGERFRLGVQFEVWPEDKSGKFVNALEIAVDKPPFGNDDWWWFTRDEGFWVELNGPAEIGAFEAKLDMLVERATAVIRTLGSFVTC